MPTYLRQSLAGLLEVLREVVDLRLEPRIFLLSELELKLSDLLLPPEIGDQRAKFAELGVRIVDRLSVEGLCRRRARRLLDAISLGANRLEVLVQQVVLLADILDPDSTLSFVEGIT